MAVEQHARPSEQLDSERLSAYLTDHLAGFTALTRIRQYRTGFSNLTYELETNLGTSVLRRPPFGPRHGSAHDMVREYGVLLGIAGLGGAGSLAPTPLLVCEDEAVLGAPFYLMEHVGGPIVRRAADGTFPHLAPAQLDTAATSLARTLARLHGASLEGTSLAQLGRPEGYVERQVEGWARRFAKAKTDNLSSAEDIVAHLRENMPADTPGALVHNDYKFDNVVFVDESYRDVAAVLDWEMCTVGNPLMDLGLTLAYWAHDDEVVEMPFLGVNCTHLPGCPRRDALVESYRSALTNGASAVPDDLTYYFVFGNFKIAGIVQQIYARYAAGHTRDTRFAKLNYIVDYLLARARRSMATGHIA